MAAIRARYTMSGTDMAYAAARRAVRILFCPAVSSTDAVDAAIRVPYAMSGTTIAYDAVLSYATAIRCPVLPEATPLPFAIS
eukprot:2490248-Rhodomonas_salina.4